MIKNKISRRQFIEVSAKTGLAVGVTGAVGKNWVLASPKRFDLIIKNGLIYDGLNDKPFKFDLGIINDRIEALGSLDQANAKSVIDAGDRVVTPGFVDIHTHTDTELLINPKAESKIRQGITTELSGNCGMSVFPREKTLSPAEKIVKEKTGLSYGWTNLEEYHSLMQKKGMAVNHATLVGLGTVRNHVMGDDRRKPTDQEMNAMKSVLSEAMIQGAFGMSDGLENAPDRFFSTDEIIDLLRIVAKHGGFYATHMRSEDLHLMEAVAAAIYTSQTAEIPLHIAHLKAVGGTNYYKVPLVIDLIEKAKKRGLDVTADRYPYTAWNTSINIMFPMWAVAGGLEKFVERLRDKDLRQKMKEETLENVEGSNSWESLVVQATNNEKNHTLVGKNIREAAAQKNQDPYDFTCDLLISEGGTLSVIGFGMSEENTALILNHPLVMLCSDGRALAPYGILSENVPHPRNYGAFPRFLKVYVREKKLLALPQAIKKMTSMPAERMGLEKRGMIKKGNYADLVVFDPSKIEDKATYIQPKQYPEGIDYVIVNGQVVVEKGTHTGALPGKTLHGPGKK